MSALLQNVLVALIVLAAAGYLVARRVRARRRATPLCDDCPGCASTPPANLGEPLVGIGEPGTPGGGARGPASANLRH